MSKRILKKSSTYKVTQTMSVFVILFLQAVDLNNHILSRNFSWPSLLLYRKDG